MHAALDFALEKAGGLQHAEVLGDGRKRDVEGRGEFGNGGFAQCETSQNGAAGGVGERAEGGVQGCRARDIFNHIV